MGVEDRDLGLAAVLREIKALASMEVSTGIHGNQDAHTVYVASLHEFGSDPWTVTPRQAYFMAAHLMGLDPDGEAEGGLDEDAGAASAHEARAHFFIVVRALTGKVLQIPERSFLRSTYDLEQAQYAQMLERVLGVVIDGTLTAREALLKFAIQSQRRFRRGLTRYPKLANAPLTVEVKGSNKPLVNRGKMRRAILSQVLQDGRAIAAPAADDAE